MNLSRTIAILALIAQIGNATQAFFVGILPPDQSLLVAGILAAIQAFTDKVTKKK